MALLTIEEMLRPASPTKETQSYDQPVRPQVKETASERIRRWSEGMGRILANIGRTHYEELTRLQTVFNDKDIVRIRQFHDDVEFHHGAFQAVGKSQNQNPNVFMPLIESKLPENSRVSVLSKRDKQWGIDKFLDVLGKEIRIREAIEPNDAARKVTESLREVPMRSSPATTSSLHMGSEPRRCVFCYQEHQNEKCTRVRYIQTRGELIKRYSRCFVCLKVCYRAKDCRSKESCQKCRE